MARKATTVSRDEARDFYLQIFDEFAVEIYDLGNKARGERTIDNRDKAVLVAEINARLRASGSDQTIVESNVNGEYDCWQTWHTYDDWSREQAESAFDQAWPTDQIEVEAPTQRASKTAPSTLCRCGCGDHTAPGKGYLPGHDARHAGQVARAILNLPADAAGMAEGADLMLTLPTEALRRKAMAQVERGNNRTMGAPTGGARRVMARLAPDGVVHGYVMVPRPTFRIGQRVPAQTFLVSGEQRMNINDAKDGSGDWLDAEGYNGQTQKYWLKRFRPTTTV